MSSPGSPFSGSSYRLTAGEVVWREWDGLYAAFCCNDESTHYIDPISSLVIERLRSAVVPFSFDNLVSSALSECGDDTLTEQIIQLLEDRLPHLQRIGLIEVVSM